MHAVLLFSALLHIAAVGLLAAMALRAWLDSRRPKEPSFPEYVGVAAALGVAVMVVATVLMWLARPFGPALMSGLVAGVIAGAAFLLALGALPTRAAHGGPPTLAARLTVLVFVGALVLTEVIAFSFLASAASMAVRNA